MKSNQTVGYAMDLINRTVTASMPGRENIVVRLTDMHPNMREYATLFGIQSRLSNGAAIDKQDRKTGVIRSDAEMKALRHEALMQIADHLNSGAAEWDITRAAGTGPDTSGITLAAIMRALSKPGEPLSAADADAKVDAFALKHNLERKAAFGRIALIPEVADAIAAIKAERAGVVVSLTDLD